MINRKNVIIFVSLLLLISCNKRREIINNNTTFEQKNENELTVYDENIENKTIDIKNEQYLIKDIGINGEYKIINAYSMLYNHVFSGENVRKIETKKIGMIISVNYDEIIFDNKKYKIFIGNGWGEEGVLEYDYFITMWGGMNYGSFDRNIIGNDYNGIVKTMTMESENNKYYLFFADNKIIINIGEIGIPKSIEDTQWHETEFNDLVISYIFDKFFYVAEKIIE